MDEFYWETTWRYSGIPKVGDYIQIRGFNTIKSYIILQGLVVSVKDNDIKIIPKPANGYYATSWRRRIVPEISEIEIFTSVKELT